MLKRKRILIIFLLLIFSSCVHSIPNSGPRPIAVMTKYCSSFTCDDILFMALYEDGTFLFKEGTEIEDGCIFKYKKKKLTNNENKAISKQLGPTKDFMSLSRSYDFTDVDFADYPVLNIYLSDGKNKKAVTVVYSDYKIRETFPKELMRVYDLLHSIDREDSSEYISEYCKVFLIPASSYGSERKTIPWPKELPGLNDQYTVSLSGNEYSLIIPSAKYNEYDKYLEKLRKKDRDVLFDGKRYYIQDRPVFPYEDVWHDAFR